LGCARRTPEQQAPPLWCNLLAKGVMSGLAAVYKTSPPLGRLPASASATRDISSPPLEHFTVHLVRNNPPSPVQFPFSSTDHLSTSPLNSNWHIWLLSRLVSTLQSKLRGSSAAENYISANPSANHLQTTRQTNFRHNNQHALRTVLPRHRASSLRPQ